MLTFRQYLIKEDLSGRVVLVEEEMASISETAKAFLTNTKEKLKDRSRGEDEGESRQSPYKSIATIRTY
ncbi:MAG: hypothetical protein GF334_09845 [Candidatus Altiarchaeales archaeon]|nr:hypothetical protein [Candidatus Altiarchaeales archaeon]